MPFALHPTLARDTVEVTRLSLCRVLLMNDRRFPWLILVPERASVSEIIDLAPPDRHLLTDEIGQVSSALKAIYKPDKLNVAALGNMVAQLHVHVIARFHSDAAWPRPVWGVGEAAPYQPHQLGVASVNLGKALGLD